MGSSYRIMYIFTLVGVTFNFFFARISLIAAYVFLILLEYFSKILK